ncbi:MAG: hypothetical protein ACJ76N_23185 [Thermoanaerobaculia bacterium]
MRRCVLAFLLLISVRAAAAPPWSSKALDTSYRENRVASDRLTAEGSGPGYPRAHHPSRPPIRSWSTPPCSGPEPR